MKKKILNIGSVTKDTIITPEGQYTQIGGAVYYQLSTLNTLKIDNDSIILIGEDVLEMLGAIGKKNNIHKIICRESMKYYNIYHDNNSRIQMAYFPKDCIKAEDLEKLNINPNEYSKAIISSLSPYEIDVNLIKLLKENNIETILSIQGFIRRLDEDNNITTTRWNNYKEYLKYSDIISSDINEFKTAFDVEVKDERIHDFMDENSLKMIIMTEASKGSRIYTADEKIKVPAIRSRKEIDYTGLGDTYLSAFIAQKDNTTIFNAGIYASICAKNKLENKGVLKTSKNKIEKEYKEILNHCRQNDKWNDYGQ